MHDHHAMLPAARAVLDDLKPRAGEARGEWRGCAGLRRERRQRAALADEVRAGWVRALALGPPAHVAAGCCRAPALALGCGAARPLACTRRGGTATRCAARRSFLRALLDHGAGEELRPRRRRPRRDLCCAAASTLLPRRRTRRRHTCDSRLAQHVGGGATGWPSARELLLLACSYLRVWRALLDYMC